MIFCDCQYEIHFPCISSKACIKLTVAAKNIQHIGTKALTNAYNCGIFLMTDRCSCLRAVLTNFFIQVG